MAMCVSVSGGSRMTIFFPVTIDQPEGTVKVAPPGVTRGVSAATRCADLVSTACGDAAMLEADVAVCAKVVNARKATRAVRYMDMGVTRLVKMGKLRDQQYTGLSRTGKIPAHMKCTEAKT